MYFEALKIAQGGGSPPFGTPGEPLGMDEAGEGIEPGGKRTETIEGMPSVGGMTESSMVSQRKTCKAVISSVRPVNLCPSRSFWMIPLYWRE
jgi:hypothetical protein